jgi:hypothetical protein
MQFPFSSEEKGVFMEDPLPQWGQEKSDFFLGLIALSAT